MIIVRVRVSVRIAVVGTSIFNRGQFSSFLLNTNLDLVMIVELYLYFSLLRALVDVQKIALMYRRQIGLIADYIKPIEICRQTRCTQ